VQFSILSWNIHGKRLITKTSFAKIAPALEALGADIMCLQEAHEMRARLSSLPAFRSRHRALPGEGFNQNLILSKYPLEAQGEIDFPFSSIRTLERALWADVRVGDKTVRIYNCHFGIFGTGQSSRERQLKLVLDHAEAHNGPTIVCGDFNTTISRMGVTKKVAQLFLLYPEYAMQVAGQHIVDDERYAFIRIAETRGYREAADISTATWRVAPFPWEPFKLKLDWLLVRDLETPKVVLHPYISDHKAIQAECLLR
jgi:endonuclease/exonuclease/phosphatase family metal-dependent hydrolase